MDSKLQTAFDEMDRVVQENIKRNPIPTPLMISDLVTNDEEWNKWMEANANSKFPDVLIYK